MASKFDCSKNVFPFCVAGTNHYTEGIQDVCKDRRIATWGGSFVVLLRREPENEQDHNAIVIFMPGYVKCGYVPRIMAEKYAPVFDDLGMDVKCAATVFGAKSSYDIVVVLPSIENFSQAVADHNQMYATTKHPAYLSPQTFVSEQPAADFHIHSDGRVSQYHDIYIHDPEKTV